MALEHPHRMRQKTERFSHLLSGLRIIVIRFSPPATAYEGENYRGVGIMSTVAVSSGGVRSSLNPNAPLFIPAAFQQVEDFSPEWWELVKTTGWFRDHWVRQHQEQETFDGDDEEDMADLLLPDSFDLGISDEFPESELEIAEPFYQTMEAEAVGSFPAVLEKKSGLVSDAEAVLKSLSMISPKNGASRLVLEPAKYREKPAQCVSPKFTPRRIIHQPR